MHRYLYLIPLLCTVLYALPTDKQVEEISKQYLGDSYVWGGTNPKTGMDCSGYTKYVFNKAGIVLPRTAWSQSKKGSTVTRNELKKGDLLFFLTDKTRGIPVTHVGIYLGNDKFIHAASKKKGIIISSLSQSSYDKKFVLAKRVIKNNIAHMSDFYVALDEEAMKSSMQVKITSFGGKYEIF